MTKRRRSRAYYTCKHCKSAWTQAELYSACCHNEDEVVELRSMHRCPNCWPEQSAHYAEGGYIW